MLCIIRYVSCLIWYNSVSYLSSVSSTHRVFMIHVSVVFFIFGFECIMQTKKHSHFSEDGVSVSDICRTPTLLRHSSNTPDTLFKCPLFYIKSFISPPCPTLLFSRDMLDTFLCMNSLCFELGIIFSWGCSLLCYIDIFYSHIYVIYFFLSLWLCIYHVY